MKKIISFLTLLLVFTGCSLSDMNNTPTKKVETYLNNYQTLDEGVLTDLDEIVALETNFSDEQKKTYRDITKKHYQDLTYKIVKETINGDSATVEVEIEVKDYSKIIQETNDYLSANKDEFNDEEGNYDESKFIDYKLDKLKEAEDTVKYTLYLTLTKDAEDDWQLDELNDVEKQKLLGTYQY